MALTNYLKIDASQGTSAGPASTPAPIPGTTVSADQVLVINNLGNVPVFFNLGTSNAVTVVNGTGTVVWPGSSLAVDIKTGGFTYIAIATFTPGTSATVSLTSGS
jgi:hypothetical protein